MLQDTNDDETKRREFKKLTNQSLTLNTCGTMIEIENPHLTASLKMMDKLKPVADLGVAFGYTSEILLNNGFDVIANDLDPRHLDYLWANVSDEHRRRLKLKPGNALDLDIEADSLGGIVALRWIHFLSGEEIRKIMQSFYKWLAPNGVLVVTASTPSVNSMLPKEEQPQLDLERIYYERVREGVEWPGVFLKSEFLPANRVQSTNIPDFVNVLFNDVLIRELTRAGFQIFKVEYLDRDFKDNVYNRDGLKQMEASAICIKR
jgi:SAM-dependent methyltransferase